jgi:hypothetical protein
VPTITATELPHETVWNITTAGASARSLHVVADLGVADHIDDAPVPVEELGPTKPGFSTGQ